MPISPRAAHPPGPPPPTAAAGPLHRLAAAGGQAAVELVVLLPLAVLLLAVAWQVVLAGYAVWSARVAVRAAARAHAVGADPAGAARAHLPHALERGLRVAAGDGGDVRLSLRVPAVVPAVSPGRVSASGHFEPQGG